MDEGNAERRSAALFLRRRRSTGDADADADGAASR
jgi:hypothetical protein